MGLWRIMMDGLEKNYDTRPVLIIGAVITVAEFTGIALILGFSLATDDWVKVFTTTTMIAMAVLITGVAIGFLFGIPRTIQEKHDAPNLRPESAEIHKPEGTRRYKVNTNLEQVSDWLTKILVGVGLTQFREIKTAMDDLLNRFSADLPSLQNAKPLMTATIVLYLILGFLGGYALTRLYLSSKISQADSEIG